MEGEREWRKSINKETIEKFLRVSASFWWASENGTTVKLNVYNAATRVPFLLTFDFILHSSFLLSLAPFIDETVV